MLRYRRAIPAKNYFLWLREAMRLSPRGLAAILQANKMYLRGLAADRMETGGLRPAPTFFETGISRLKWHTRRGHTIVLLSGTLEPLAEEVARALEAELAGRGVSLAIRVCATRLEEVDGRWTGKILSEAMFGEAKLREARRIAAELKCDLGQCYAYGDNANDRWLLAAVGQPVAVNPSNYLGRMARERGWAVLHWREGTNAAQGTAQSEEPSDRAMCRVVMQEAGPGVLDE
jgi:HAD superfamily hydrolase (TIGR01490 family)